MNGSDISRLDFLRTIAAAAVASSLPGSTGTFYVFWRPGGAQLNILVEGHVGFAYQNGDFEFIAGAVEEAHGDTSPGGKDFFLRLTPNPLLTMGAANNVNASPPYVTRYDFYKAITVKNARPEAARAKLAEIAREPFIIGIYDCLAAVRSAFWAYGGDFSPYVAFTRGPSNFFRSLSDPWSPQSPIVIPWPEAQLDASFYSQIDREGLRDDVVSADGGGIIYDNFTPDLGATEEMPSYSKQSSILVRRGFAAVYEELNCSATGNLISLRTGDFVNLRNLGWQGQSYCISANAFDPHEPPIIGRPPRFASDADRQEYFQTLQSRDQANP